MPKINDMRYLFLRGEIWWYNRRFSKKIISLIDCEARTRFSLKTSSLETAKQKRNQVEANQNEYWNKLLIGDADDIKSLSDHYEKIIEKSRTLKIDPYSTEQLKNKVGFEVLLNRLELLENSSNIQSKSTRQAIVGTAKEPNPKISKVLDIYLEKLIIPKIQHKSHRQKQHVINPKIRVVNYFKERCGNKRIYDITRADAQKFQKWLQDRILSTSTDKIATNTANRYLTEIRGVILDYYKYQGKEDVPDPFRNMKFKEKVKSKRDPFSTEYIKDLLISPDKLAKLDIEARVVIYAMINTGLRPSEICNILPETIFTDNEIPYISIVEQSGRELKSTSAVRDIPLIGVSLHAFKLIKSGILEKYRDKSDTFSATANSYFKTKKLFPQQDGEIIKKFSIYSFRHSFKKRMTEANVDVEIRDVSMGHKIDKPDYGDYGSIEFRMSLLKEIDLPYDIKIFD